MIRPLSLFVLLGASAIAFAEPLYKWVEPDGAITFSVTKPPAGVSYETVNPADSSNKATASSAASNDGAATQQKITPAGTQPSLEAALPSSTRTNQPTERIAPQAGAQAGAQVNANGITRSAEATRTDINTAEAKVQNSDQTASVNARTRKQRQCEDLQKRVVSLERRLKTRLTPEDMDNTVVHMARYQRSYDQHCVQ